MSAKTTMKCHFVPVRVGIMQKRKLHVWEAKRKMKHFHTVRNFNEYRCYGKSIENPKEIKNIISYVLTGPLQGI